MATRRLGQRYDGQLCSVAGSRRQMWSTGATVCTLPNVPIPVLNGASFEHILVSVACGDVDEDLWLLDTGSPTSVIGLQHRRHFEVSTDGQQTQRKLKIPGREVVGLRGTCLLGIKARLGGQGILLKAETMLVPGWDDFPVLGLGGALDQIRLAIDPHPRGDGFGTLSFARAGKRSSGRATPSHQGRAP